MKSLFEENGGTYTQVGDYILPDLVLPDEEPASFSRYGRLHLKYIKNHKKVLYISLLTSGKLNKYLNEIDQTAHSRVEQITKEMAKQQGVNEMMKATDQMKWVGLMNNIKHSAEEAVFHELIYR